MNTPILTKYKFDPTGKDPENLIGGERHTVAAGPKNKIIAVFEGPFFSASAKVRLLDGSYLEPWVDFQPVHHFPEASKRTGKSCTCFIKILNESVNGDVFIEYQVVGGEFTFNSITLENLLWAIINDERSVLWDNINNRPATYPPSYHTHDIFNDTYGWDDRIAFSNWISDYLILGGERLNYEGFTNKVNVVLDEITTIQANILAQVAEHEADHTNPHADTAKALGYSKLQNLATADEPQALEGQRTDLRLTVKTAESILADAVKGYSVNLIHQGIIPVSRFGNLNFLQPGIIGSFEGASMVDAHDHYAQVVENDGTFIRLRPGTNGESIALYYDYATNIHRNINTFTITNTNNKYAPAGLDQAYIPARLFDCQGDVIAGIMYNKAALPATSDYKYWIALTNGTLDSTKHNCAQIGNAFFTMDDGSTQEFSPSWTQLCMVGSRIYVIHQNPNVATTMEVGGAISGNAIPQIYLGYINVADIVAGGSVTFTQITGWTTTFLGQVRAAARSMQICDQVIGRSNQHVLVRYDGNQYVRAQYRSWPGGYGKMVANSDGTLTMLVDFTINVDGRNNSNISVYPIRFIIDVNAKTARPADTMNPFTVVDDTASTLKMTVVTNGSNLNYFKLRGVNDGTAALSGDYHGSRLITKKGFSICTSRQQASNVGMRIDIQQIPNFVDIDTYWRNPAAYTNLLFRTIGDGTSYGSEAKGNLRCPILFPNNRLGFWAFDGTNTFFASQPLVGNGDFVYKLIGLGTVPGFQPSNDRVRATVARPEREIITEINGSSVVTHCRAISDDAPTGAANIDSSLNTSGSISTDVNYLRAQGQRVLNQLGITAAKFRCILFVPTDGGMSLMLKIVGFTPAQANGITDMITVIATVTYNGARDGVLAGWTANLDDIVSKPQSVGTSDISRILTTFGLLTYKVGGEYIIAMGGFYCPYTVGPANNLPLVYMKMTNGRLSGNPSNMYLVSPYVDLLSNTPFALPGKGLFVTYSDNNYTVPVTPSAQSAVGPCAIVLAAQGENFDTIRQWTIPGNGTSVLISQTVEQGWILYFAEEIPVILNGREYTLPITSIDLRNVKANPASTTFFVYIEAVDVATAKYTISATELAAATTRMFIGTVATNTSQINTINVTKRSGLNKYQISAVKAGSSIPVSTGLPFQRGNWSQE
ncbi:putative virion structural protein [Erwinia phage vB_EamM_Desertfox]|uniref:Putative virion structural protein n=1 Tax=Erwinia phage vB_EamM_Desertfox TaxID=2060127 RepID=A0A2H5BII0_9CAUD|nr:putative virion structural protein [Erwinia phage vB_EamM_Desertfox]AUG86127.1 putative virion structural protein [Erwinia phage vB_EamM_Desertfox]